RFSEAAIRLRAYCSAHHRYHFAAGRHLPGIRSRMASAMDRGKNSGVGALYRDWHSSHKTRKDSGKPRCGCSRGRSDFCVYRKCGGNEAAVGVVRLRLVILAGASKRQIDAPRTHPRMLSGFQRHDAVKPHAIFAAPHHYIAMKQGNSRRLVAALMPAKQEYGWYAQ